MALLSPTPTPTTHLVFFHPCNSHSAPLFMRPWTCGHTQLTRVSRGDGWQCVVVVVGTVVVVGVTVMRESVVCSGGGGGGGGMVV